jgi:hypothetical protein
MAAPSVRALHLQTLDRTLDALGAERAGAIRATMSPATVRRVRGAGTLEWLPVEYLVHLCEAAHAHTGDAALEGWGAAALDAVVRAPLARAFTDAAFAAVGRPELVLRGLCHAWPLLYRDCGDLVLTRTEPGAVRLVHSPVPPALRRKETVLPLIGALGAVPRRCIGAPGTGTAEWDPASPRFVYTVRWQAGPP